MEQLGVTPVQVVDELPPMPAKPTKAPKKPNPTGLSRAEIRLLAGLVHGTAGGRHVMVNERPEVLKTYDDYIAKLKAAIRKLQAAAGVR